MAKETKFVVPKDGLLIRFPKQPKTVLPEGGATVPWIGPDGRFWRRRKMDGVIDVYEDKAHHESSTKKTFGSPVVERKTITKKEDNE